ncbi:MAG: 16S rRNA (cytidine(1402)-2'-O)-methyltransferase [Firmicutes bacterium]|jgi:16S rRNA (cytidine1402-2'-O)-methyltransferase|nr:16S rRNA (cytidine(1402)-2'-O)-methyltransferase [Bacillota bacterium]
MLYVCPTPIGNLEDITLRVLRTLKEVDLIAAEDTRRTVKLLNHYEIKTPLISLHEHNEAARVDFLLEQLRAGKQIALVSDAGMPGISDPGRLLINAVIEAGIPCTVLPGATAAVTAYVQSGILSDQFLFYGFLPRRGSERQAELVRLAQIPYPIVLYEAPHRLVETLSDLHRCLGNRRASVSRELTKKFEETMRGSLAELLDYFAVQQPRGEFVITVAGSTGSEGAEAEITEGDIKLALQELLDRGFTKKAAVQEVASRYRLPKNRIYKLALDLD